MRPLLSIHLDIILNPVAGQGTALGRIDEIRTILQARNIIHQIHITERPRHAIELARDIAADADTAVIAAGGDGTCNEVINGLMSRPKITHPPLFGVFPIGRGNDFAFGAGIPGDLNQSISLMMDKHSQKLDIGKVSGGDYPDGRHFGNGVGVGFDAVVGFEAAGLKHAHGSMAYTIAALKTLVLYPDAPLVEFSVNGVVSRIEPALISIMNGKRMGGAFYMAPEADSHDGRLDWCHTAQGSRIKLLSAMMAYTKGKQADRADTFTGHATNITIKALKGSLAVHADGETICRAGDKLEITIIPGALTLIGSGGI